MHHNYVTIVTLRFSARLANTAKDEESERDNRVFACNLAKYLPI